MELSSVKYAALNITHACNLRCSYCYAGEKSARSMDIETARAAVDFLASQTESRCVVTFFGGEPLVRFDLIKELVTYSREKYNSTVEYRMSTNGTLLTPEITDFLKHHGIYFTLSLDGGRDQHNASRSYADGRGSYDAVVRHLHSVFEMNPYALAVSVVVPRTVRYLAKGIEDLFGSGFRYVLQSLDYSAAWRSADIKRLKEQYKLLSRFYMDAMKSGSKIYYSPFDERIKTWAQKPYGKGDLCDLANSQIAIAPSGRIYPCVQFIGVDDDMSRQFAIGDVTRGFDAKKRESIVLQNWSDKESCIDCALNGRCATYCGCVNWRATGDIRKVPPIICEHERMLMPIVDSMANDLWAGDVALFKRKFYDRTYPISSYVEDCLKGERSRLLVEN